jgi:hypothetical protein
MLFYSCNVIHDIIHDYGLYATKIRWTKNTDIIQEFFKNFTISVPIIRGGMLRPAKAARVASKFRQKKLPQVVPLSPSSTAQLTVNIPVSPMDIGPSTPKATRYLYSPSMSPQGAPTTDFNLFGRTRNGSKSNKSKGNNLMDVIMEEPELAAPVAQGTEVQSEVRTEEEKQVVLAIEKKHEYQEFIEQLKNTAVFNFFNFVINKLKQAAPASDSMEVIQEAQTPKDIYKFAYDIIVPTEPDDYLQLENTTQDITEDTQFNIYCEIADRFAAELIDRNYTQMFELNATTDINSIIKIYSILISILDSILEPGIEEELEVHRQSELMDVDVTQQEDDAVQTGGDPDLNEAQYNALKALKEALDNILYGPLNDIISNIIRGLPVGGISTINDDKYTEQARDWYNRLFDVIAKVIAITATAANVIVQDTTVQDTTVQDAIEKTKSITSSINAAIAAINPAANDATTINAAITAFSTAIDVAISTNTNSTIINNDATQILKSINTVLPSKQPRGKNVDDAVSRFNGNLEKGINPRFIVVNKSMKEYDNKLFVTAKEREKEEARAAKERNKKQADDDDSVKSEFKTIRTQFLHAVATLGLFLNNITNAKTYQEIQALYSNSSRIDEQLQELIDLELGILFYYAEFKQKLSITPSNKSSLDDVLIEFVRDMNDVLYLDSNGDLVKGNSFRYECKKSNKLYIINNAANISTDAITKHGFCPLSSIIDGMGECTLSSNANTYKADYIEYGDMDFQITDKTSYYQGKLTLEPASVTSLMGKNATYNIKFKGLNSTYTIDTSVENIKISDKKIQDLEAHTILKNTLIAILRAVIDGSKADRRNYLLDGSNIFKQIINIVTTPGGSLASGFTPSSEDKQELLQALFSILGKGAGDIFQEINAVCKNGGYTNTPIYNPPGQVNKIIPWVDGNAFRCFAANDRPSASRFIFLIKYGDSRQINNLAFGGYISNTIVIIKHSSFGNENPCDMLTSDIGGSTNKKYSKKRKRTRFLKNTKKRNLIFKNTKRKTLSNKNKKAFKNKKTFKNKKA